MQAPSDSTSPDFPPGNHVYTWINTYIRQGNSQDSWSSRDCVRAVSKCALAALVTLRNIAFIPVSLSLPFSNANWVFAVGNVIGVSSLDFWAGTRFIDDSLPQGIGLEKVFSKKRTSFLHHIANIGNVAISLLSQIPHVYPAMQYNKGSEAIPAGLLVGLGGSVLPLRSIQLSIEEYFNLTAAKQQDIDPKKQKNFVALLQANRQHFINLSQEDKTLFTSQLNTIKNIEDSPEKILIYWNHLLSITNPPPKTPLSTPAYASTLGVKTIGAIITGIYQYVLGVYTFTKTKENVWNNDIAAGVLSGLVVGSTLFLTGTSMVKSAEKLFHSITGINKEARAEEETLAEKFRSKTMTVLQNLGVGINFLSLGATYVIWNDFFKNKTERTFFEISMCSAIFLLLHAAIPEVINDAEEQILASYSGTPDEKEAIRISREYQKLIDSISKISPENFEEFLPYLPSNISTAITPPLPTTAPNIEEGASLGSEYSLNTLPEDNLHSPLLADESGNSSSSNNSYDKVDEVYENEYANGEYKLLNTEDIV